MSDASVAQALKSNSGLVVVEAPAGCGKTFQGSDYAKSVASELGHERVLILAHTHAACDVFADRTTGCSGRVEISTIDSLICQIANAYHIALGLPQDCSLWARTQKNGYALLAAKVSQLVSRSRVIAAALAQRYPVVICDEHQDASPDQHALALACRDAGSRLRIFGDPMQGIYATTRKELEANETRWQELKTSADSFEELDYPHRWSPEAKPLGEWLLEARGTLRRGGQIDLCGKLPRGITLIVAENQSRDPRGYFITGDPAKQIYGLVNKTSPLLILTMYNERADAIRAFFGRRVPIWEGHVRDALSKLVQALADSAADAEAVGMALCDFLPSVAVGCSASALGDALLAELRSRCAKKRSGKPAAIQTLAAAILDEPNHRGVGAALRMLHQLSRNDSAFAGVQIDYAHEFWDAVRLASFENPTDGLAELTRRRTHLRHMPQPKTISTIHKAKGLECKHVVVMPCDGKHFGDTTAARLKLYVAMTRAMSSLTLVVSKTQASPLIKF
jgi:hypothetical protein